MTHTSPPRSWPAVRGKSPDAVRGELRLRASTLSGDDQLTFQIVGATSEIPIEIVRSVAGYKPGAANPACAGRFMLLEGARHTMVEADDLWRIIGPSSG